MRRRGTHGKCGFRMRRHRPIGSLKYPGPHFRFAVLLAAAEAGEVVDGDCCGAAGDDVTAATAGGSEGGSEVFPLLAISASTIWTILSLLDGEYGSSSAAEGDAVDTTAAAGVLLDAGGFVVLVLVDEGLDGASVGSV